MKLALMIAAAFVALFLARHWDYQDSQRVRQAEYSARIAHR